MCGCWMAQTPQPLIWLARRAISSSVFGEMPVLLIALESACSASNAPGTANAGWFIRACTVLVSFSYLAPVAYGATVKGPARDVGGGRLVAMVTDPDGNVLRLVQDREVLRNG